MGIGGAWGKASEGLYILLFIGFKVKEYWCVWGGGGEVQPPYSFPLPPPSVSVHLYTCCMAGQSFSLDPMQRSRV